MPKGPVAGLIVGERCCLLFQEEEYMCKKCPIQISCRLNFLFRFDLILVQCNTIWLISFCFELANPSQFAERVHFFSPIIKGPSSTSHQIRINQKPTESRLEIGSDYFLWTSEKLFTARNSHSSASAQHSFVKVSSNNAIMQNTTEKPRKKSIIKQ